MSVSYNSKEMSPQYICSPPNIDTFNHNITRVHDCRKQSIFIILHRVEFAFTKELSLNVQLSFF